jgi:hypothetical protein
MASQGYLHRIQFCGTDAPGGKYQLQICQMGQSGQLVYRAQWRFSTIRNLVRFLQKYFPDSQALPCTGGLRFQEV